MKPWLRIHRRFYPVLLVGTLSLLLLTTVRMISAGQAVKLRADTRIVEIDVTVRDSQGRPVEDLKASDFTVTDNGKARPFTIFSFNRGAPEHPSSDSPGPQLDDLPMLAGTPALPPGVFTNTGSPSRPQTGHSTIILLDGINGWFDNFAHARQGVLDLLTTLPADEKIALYVLSPHGGMGILQDYTVDRSKLAAAVTKYIARGMVPAPPGMDPNDEGMFERLPARVQSNGGLSSTHGLERPSDFQAKGLKPLSAKIAAEDVRSAFNAMAEQLRKLPGRKSIFWVTQGFPPSLIRDDRDGWGKTFADLNNANISVNTVDSNGLGGPRRFWGPGGILMMQQVAEATGGQAYFHRNDLAAAIASGIADARSSYTLGFYLTAIDGKYHALKVSVDRPGLQLNYRQGYYAREEAVLEAAGRKSMLQSAMLNPLGHADVGIAASFDVVPGKPRDTLNAHLTLAPGPLSLQQTAAGYTGKVEEMFLELDANGHEVGRFSDTKQFTINASGKYSFDGKGVTLSQAIPLVAGAVKLSILVRDTASGRTGSLVIPLVPVAGQRTPK